MAAAASRRGAALLFVAAGISGGMVAPSPGCNYKHVRITTHSAPHAATVQEVEGLLAARDAHRAAKRFSDASGVKKQLDALHVVMCDRRKLWTFRSQSSTSGFSRREWDMSEEVDSALVERLLTERERKKEERDTPAVDELFDRLSGMNLHIDDQLMAWHVIDPRSKVVQRLRESTETLDIDACLAELRPLRTPIEVTAAIGALSSVLRGDDALDEMREAESRGIRADLVCFNAALAALTHASRPADRALSMLADLKAAPELEADTTTYNSAITACAKGKAWESAVKLLEELEAPGDDHPAPDTITYNAVISACASAQQWELASSMLGRMQSAGHPPNAISYTHAISASASAVQPDEACRLLHVMEDPDTGVAPTRVHYGAAISACALAAQPKRAMGLLGDMEARGVAANVVVCNAIITAFEKAGEPESALQMLDDMPGKGVRPDAISHNAVISAFARSGQWEPALGVLGRITIAGLEPTLVSYSATMQAMAASNRLDEGFELLERAKQAGLLTPPTLALSDENRSAAYVLLRALLEACRAAGDHGRAAAVQAEIDGFGLGSVARAPEAATAIGGAERQYNNQDDGRPGGASESVRALCSALERKTKYKPQFQALPYAFVKQSTVKEQRRSLVLHAEKQALADALRERGKRMQRGQADDGALDVRINFKACPDCHAFFKAASCVVRGKILLREPKLVHTFEAGKCSCGDKWRWEAVASNAPAAEE